MEVGNRVRDGEGGLEVEMEGAMAKGREIDQRRAGMNRLQGNRQVDGYRRCSTAAFGIDDGKDFTAAAFATRLAPGLPPLLADERRDRHRDPALGGPRGMAFTGAGRLPR